MVKYKHCVYAFCRNDIRYLKEKNVTFYPFPKPKRNLEKCLRWISSCGRADLNDTTRINKNTFVCSKHFVAEIGPTEEFPDPIRCDKIDDTSTANSEVNYEVYHKDTGMSSASAAEESADIEFIGSFASDDNQLIETDSNISEMPGSISVMDGNEAESCQNSLNDYFEATDKTSNMNGLAVVSQNQTYFPYVEELKSKYPNCNVLTTPPGWLSSYLNGELSLFKLNTKTGAIAMSFSVSDTNPSGTLKVWNRELPVYHPFLQEIPSDNNSYEALMKTLDQLTNYRACIGSTDERLREFFETRRQSIGYFCWQSNGIHSLDCERMTLKASGRCNKCDHYRHTLQRGLLRQNQSTSFCFRNTCMSRSELETKVDTQSKRLHALNNTVKILKTRIRKLTGESSNE